MLISICWRYATARRIERINAYDTAVLDRDIPGSSGDELAGGNVASGSGMPILATAAMLR